MTHDDFLSRYREAHYALHRNWTKAVGTADYVKDDWRKLQRALDEFARHTAAQIGYEGPFLLT